MRDKTIQKEDNSKKSDLPSFLRSKQQEKTDDQKNVLALRMITYLEARHLLTPQSEWSDRVVADIPNIPQNSSQFVEKVMRDYLKFSEDDLNALKKDDIFSKIAYLRQEKANKKQDVILACLSGKSVGR